MEMICNITRNDETKLANAYEAYTLRLSSMNLSKINQHFCKVSFFLLMMT